MTYGNKMKTRILVLIFLTVIGLGIIDSVFKPKVKLWTYDDLPNNYVIKKESETNMIIGKKENNKIITKKEDKKIGLDEYIAEFSYGDKYITLKCLNPNDENNSIDVKFYIIDSKEEVIYGPYDLEETYLEEKAKIVDEKISDWIKTIEIN